MEGILNIYKPPGMSSFRCLSLVKKKLGLDKKTKIGHLGTLDPLASGVLIILIGRNYTRRASEFHSRQKTYRAVVTWGVETTTLDNAGEIVATSDVIPTREQIKTIIPSMVGDIEIEIPKYSAVHINGERAYDLARKGIDFTPPKKTVKITRFEMLDKPIPERAREGTFFEIECETGTYIRSLAKVLAYKLGTVATASTIIRTKVGDFDIKNSKTIEEVTINDLITELDLIN